ncbi:MAG: hypothetical protein LBD55_08570 [Treponema sp.]|nr:hypothetical protein [Treponema sp.]
MKMYLLKPSHWNFRIDGAPSNIIRLRAQGRRTIIFTNNRQLSGPQADSRQEAERLVMEAEEE